MISLLGGCNMLPLKFPWDQPEAKPSPLTRSAAGTLLWSPTGNSDLDVTAAVLLDLTTIQKLTTLADGTRDAIILNQVTNPPSYFISDEQIASETRRMSIPEGVIADLQTRNQAQTEITWLPPGLPFTTNNLDVLPQDLEELRKEFETRFPNAFAGVWIWLPGYSPDGQWAMLRFSFAPTPNGATGTYILAKTDTGKWQVVGRNINYLVKPTNGQP